MDFKFGLATPSQLWSLDWADRQALLKAIDAAGFNHVFLADHVSFRNGAGADGFVETAALAQLHTSLGVMISIYLLPLRHPLPVARQLASMARVAPGRFTFGVGIGGEDPHELEVCGVSPRRRGVRANESLEIIQFVSDDFFEEFIPSSRKKIDFLSENSSDSLATNNLVEVEYENPYPDIFISY